MKEHPFLWPAASAGFKESESGALERGAGEEDDLPLRAELFCAQQMGHHGRAQQQQLFGTPQSGNASYLAQRKKPPRHPGNRSEEVFYLKKRTIPGIR